MNIKKKDLLEIIDSNGELIGKNDVPQSGSDLESQANNTTDYNASVGTQPFRYDMLGRFGFTMLPFFEGKEDQSQQDLFHELTGLINSIFINLTNYYIKHPNLLKSDNRKAKEENIEIQNRNNKFAKEAINIFQKHFERAFKSSENLDESTVAEDKIVKSKCDDEMSKRGEDNGIKDKKLEKIVGLINKLDKKNIDKIINLLERK